MNAETRIVADMVPPVQASTRPQSAVSTGVGVAGLFGLFAWIGVARLVGMDGPSSALVAVVACGIPMVLWSLLVDKVHRNPSTGLDWDNPPRTWRAAFDISAVRIAGLWTTWAIIACAYMFCRWYWRGNYIFSMNTFAMVLPWLLVISIPYALWTDRRMKNPRDGSWMMGAFITGRRDEVDWEILKEHGRQWTVKAFFLAFMVSIVPIGFGQLIRMPIADVMTNPVAMAHMLILVMFVIDVMFATVGYALTLKPLDAHIRSANPFVAGWVAALICYPPFVLMDQGRVLYYAHNENAWVHWLSSSSAALAIMGAILVILTGIYAWATVAFGLRFSNLTHRGILTHGPYSFTRHPAYLAKNTFWWLSAMPLLALSGSMVDGIRNAGTLAIVSGVYYWRARTEERHLGADPAYQAYWAWSEENMPWRRMVRSITKKFGLPERKLA